MASTSMGSPSSGLASSSSLEEFSSHGHDESLSLTVHHNASHQASHHASEVGHSVGMLDAIEHGHRHISSLGGLYASSSSHSSSSLQRRLRISYLSSVFFFVMSLVFLLALIHAVTSKHQSVGDPFVDPRSPCSQHGMFEDDVCRCDNCYVGATCETKSETCVVDASSGSPFFTDDYWISEVRNGNKDSTVTIAPYYHIGYGAFVGAGNCGGFAPVSGGCRNDLETEIRALHDAVGNFKHNGYTLVMGVGSTELIAASIYSLLDSSQNATVFSEEPYYNGHSGVAEFFGRNWAQSAEEAEANARTYGRNSTLEFVTSPSNPTGAMRTKQVASGTAVFDSAYFWPHFTPITADRKLSDHDVALFTLSKITGHASSRIGWAFVKNADMAARLSGYVGASGGLVRESQLRATTILASERRRGYPVLTFASERMASRWSALESVLGSSACYSLQPRGGRATDMWSGKTYAPSPAYAWIRCVSGNDCYQTMLSAGVRGRAGPKFGANKDHVRLELLMGEPDFQSMLDLLRKLQSKC